MQDSLSVALDLPVVLMGAFVIVPATSLETVALT